MDVTENDLERLMFFEQARKLAESNHETNPHDADAFSMDSINGSEAPQETLDTDINSFFESAPSLRDDLDVSMKIKEFIELNSPTVRPSYSEVVKKAIRDHHAAVEEGLLLKLSFTTIFEYLQILRIVASSLKTLERRAMFYLAAAVSDFYVPWQSMVEHKIQSASGPMDMRLAQVPKMLYVLRKEWAPMAFCISFKLETDSNILLKKADMALRKYQMHMVVANELLTRKEEVFVVSSTGKVTVRRDKIEPNADVENPLIEFIVERHSTYIQESTQDL